MIFNSKKIHYLIPITLAIAAFQVIIAVTALTINWMQLQELKDNRANQVNSNIETGADFNN